MKPLTGKQIRQRWISFFESKGHQYIPGVSLIPYDDPSLLWVNAGVTGLKKYFDGSEIPPCRRIVNVQKSIRTNDIENVGHTARHHTFFEMLGNFSIGDYFRNEVIPWAYEILTNEETGFGIPVEKLYFTYNPMDKATFELWKKCGVPESHLIPLEGNFWEIGEGPCGPDTEMFFDRGEQYDPEGLGDRLLREDKENDRYIEIWNIVFSQFNSVAGKKREEYKELPSKNIDTGSGLERIACVLQGTETNFETDLFMPLIEATKSLCNVPYEGVNKMSYRVIADHARCLCFALSDGAYFSNEGRGYVLRRIIRRAMRYGKKLGIQGSFMYRLMDVVASNYGEFYPNLNEKLDFVKTLVKAEEERFLKTLNSGEEMLRKTLQGKDKLEGKDAFLLYDTFGFPFDLTKEICLENNVEVDEEGFKACMEEQKRRAREARGDVESFKKQSADLLKFTEPSTFLYEGYTIQAKVVGTFKDGEKVDEIDESGEVVFDQTVFYSLSGGQVSDEGIIFNDKTKARVVSMSKAPAKQNLHHVELEFGSIKVGDVLTLQINASKRELTARNHSATHLLHAALCEVLGGHVEQKGSFVNEEYLRFDFPSLSRLTPTELSKIEALVNEKILEAIEEKTLVLPLEEAKKLGAEMEFSEKYGDTVRVVTFGDYSKEFCGGTHVKNTADIGLFVIESESSVASGVRRIQARTSLGAYKYLNKKRALLNQVEASLGVASDEDALPRVKSILDNLSEDEKAIKSLKDKLASSSAKSLAEEFVEKDGKFLFVKKVNGGRKDLLTLGDQLKVVHPDSLILLLGEENALVCFATGNLASSIGAGKALKTISSLLNGAGGGRNEMASGSYKDASRLEEVKQTLLGLL